MNPPPAPAISARSESIQRVRMQAQGATAAQADELRRCAIDDKFAQEAAFQVLHRTLLARCAYSYVRELRPAAWREFVSTVAAARSPGVLPWGAERAVIFAAAAILFREEAQIAGERVVATLSAPMRTVFADD
jgi:hypothetical protein